MTEFKGNKSKTKCIVDTLKEETFLVSGDLGFNNQMRLRGRVAADFISLEKNNILTLFKDCFGVDIFTGFPDKNINGVKVKICAKTGELSFKLIR